MNPVVVTIMRDSAEYVGRFFDQVEDLGCRLVIAEGDSVDDTWEVVCDRMATSSLEVTLLAVQHGGPRFGSVDHPLRWRQLGAVCEVALTAGVREQGNTDPLIYVESDLIVSGATLNKLAHRAMEYEAVATMSMFRGRFYDTWGHMKDGHGFRQYPPFFDGYTPNQLHVIDSAGSCFALSPRAAQVAHFSPVDCIRGIGRSLRDNGLQLWLDPSLAVEHP